MLHLICYRITFTIFVISFNPKILMCLLNLGRNTFPLPRYNHDMDTKSLRSRYEQLKSEIHFHNHRYHVLDAPIISDAEFDKLLNELKRIESDHPDWITDDSPTRRA